MSFFVLVNLETNRIESFYTATNITNNNNLFFYKKKNNH